MTEPFVEVAELGDFSVTDRCAGWLNNISRFLGAHSQLRANMLDSLHEHGVEIVSPSFMNQRVLSPEQRFIPDLLPYPFSLDSVKIKGPPDELIFGKAEQAVKIEKIKDVLKKCGEEEENLKKELEKETDLDSKFRIESNLARNKAYQAFLLKRLQLTESRDEDPNPK